MGVGVGVGVTVGLGVEVGVGVTVGLGFEVGAGVSVGFVVTSAGKTGSVPLQAVKMSGCSMSRIAANGNLLKIIVVCPSA